MLFWTCDLSNIFFSNCAGQRWDMYKTATSTWSSAFNNIWMFAQTISVYSVWHTPLRVVREAEGFFLRTNGKHWDRTWFQISTGRDGKKNFSNGSWGKKGGFSDELRRVPPSRQEVKTCGWWKWKQSCENRREDEAKSNPAGSCVCTTKSLQIGRLKLGYSRGNEEGLTSQFKGNKNWENQ